MRRRRWVAGRVAGRVAVAGVAVGWVLGWPGPAAADTGPWTWPVAGAREVSRPFAPPAVRYGSGHRGADLPSAPGAVVRAAGAGRVTYAGLLAGRGVVVVVHGALRTTYEPVEADVVVGAVVATGQALGRLSPGHAGCPVAACLHWGLRRGADYLDPVRLVDRGPVRLLPVPGPPRAAGSRAGAPGSGAGAGAPGAGDVGPAGGVGAGGVVAGGVGAGRVGAGRVGAGGVVAGGVVAGGVVDVGGRGAAATAAAAPPPEPVAERASWALRAADAPLGAAAVVALVVGIGLLARPRPSPGGPAGPAGTAAGGGAPAEDAEPGGPTAGPVAPVVELGAERLRRRAG